MRGLKAAIRGGVPPPPAPSVPPTVQDAGTGGPGGMSGDECARIAKPTPAPKRCAPPRHQKSTDCGHRDGSLFVSDWRLGQKCPNSRRTSVARSKEPVAVLKTPSHANSDRLQCFRRLRGKQGSKLSRVSDSGNHSLSVASITLSKHLSSALASPNSRSALP